MSTPTGHSPRKGDTHPETRGGGAGGSHSGSSLTSPLELRQLTPCSPDWTGCRIPCGCAESAGTRTPPQRDPAGIRVQPSVGPQSKQAVILVAAQTRSCRTLIR